MTALCPDFDVRVGLRARSFDITPCQTCHTFGRSLPCDVRVSGRVHDASHGNTSARFIVLCHLVARRGVGGLLLTQE